MRLESVAAVAVITMTITAFSLPAPAWAAPRSDLTVLAIAPLTTVTVCAGTIPTFRATIRNKGPVETGGFNIQWIVDGVDIYGGQLSIPPRSTDTHDHIWGFPDLGYVPITAGPHTITFIADFSNAVPESNEKNNSLSIAFTVGSC